MNFKMQELKLDMGTTPFENMFLNTYIQMADGDAIKVYLLIYKDVYNYGKADRGKIKRQLSFDDQRFDKAVDFWVNMGIFRKKRSDNGLDFIEIVSLRQTYFGQSDDLDNQTSEKAYDLAQRKSIMFDNIETIVERNLTPADITRIQETILEYKADPELVTEAFRQAKSSGNVDVKYVMGFIKTWRDQNIKSLNDLRMKEERDKLKRSYSPRRYRKATGKTNETEDNGEISSFIRRKREERLKQILGKEDGVDES
ncbi:MAG: DnaD domain protein [Anaerococcus sp.]|nr:DnaD domain protein [Anaerococcus sp.]